MDVVSAPGIRFSPERVELIKFLYVMAHGERLPSYIPIKDYIDVYEDDRVWKLMKEKEDLYCFVKLKNKTSKSSRISRVTHRGTWRGQSDEKIYNGEDHVGSCRNFSFARKEGTPKENRMVMHEYRLDGIFKALHSGYVIVHVKSYVQKDAKVNQHKDEQHMDEQVMIPNQASINRLEDEQYTDEQLLIPFQPSQLPQHQHQHQHEFDPLQELSPEPIPLLVGPEWEEMMRLNEEIGDLDSFLNLDTIANTEWTTDDLCEPSPLNEF